MKKTIFGRYDRYILILQKLYCQTHRNEVSKIKMNGSQLQEILVKTENSIKLIIDRHI